MRAVVAWRRPLASWSRWQATCKLDTNYSGPGPKVSMHDVFRVALLSAATCLLGGIAHARLVTLEPLSTFGTPDPAYDEFATDVAIDGDYALATAARTVEDPGGDPTLRQDFATAFMFHRSGTHWELVRRLLETTQIRTFPIPLAVAMQNGVAAVQTART